MANMMKGVVERGTATVIKPVNRPVAGKTGTSNNCMDTWFIGYTPEWVAGVWVGFDQKKPIGVKETGGKVSAPVWLDFMKKFLDDQDKIKYQSLVDEKKAQAEQLGIEYTAPEALKPADFIPPEGVEGIWIYKESGRRAADGAEGAFFEYFVKGTGPSTEEETQVEETTSYLESPDL